LRIAWYETEDGSGEQMKGEAEPSDSNQVETNDWSYLRLEIMAPEKAKSAKVRLILTAKQDDQEAQAYFDQIKLEEYDPEPTATPSPTTGPTNTPAPTNTPEPTPTDEQQPTSIPTTKKFKPTLRPTATKSQKQLSLNQLDQADDQQAVTGVDELRQKILGYEVEEGATNSAEQMNENQKSKPDFLALGLIGGGGVLLLGAGIPIVKNIRKYRQ
jgi:hypothetical protein